MSEDKPPAIVGTKDGMLSVPPCTVSYCVVLYRRVLYCPICPERIVQAALLNNHDDTTSPFHYTLSKPLAVHAGPDSAQLALLVMVPPD